MPRTPFIVNGSLFTMCKMREITRTVSRILHVFDPALPHFTQTPWSIACLTKHAAPLINLSVAQHLRNSAIFGQSRSAFTIWLRLRLRSGLGLGLRFGLGFVLELGLGHMQRVWSKRRLTKCALHTYRAMYTGLKR